MAGSDACTAHAHAPKSDGVLAFEKTISKLLTVEGMVKGVSFKPESDDVFIATYLKCGTTWICQIVHSLRSGGDMSFDEINLVIPHVEMAHDYGYLDLSAQQVATPRVFKTHLWWRDCPKGAGKYIYCVRDPLDVGPSLFKFQQGWFFDEGAISMSQFLDEYWLPRGEPTSPAMIPSMWHNMASWYPRRGDADVLWLHYEDIHADLAGTVSLISEFLGLGVGDADLQALAVKQASIEWMRQFPTKYDEHPLKLARNEACGRPLLAGLNGSSPGKVRQGAVGKNREELTPEMRAAIQQKWTDVMLPATGYASYDDMRRGINAELGRPKSFGT